MAKGNAQLWNWALVVLAILVGLNHWLGWGSLQYLWALLVLVVGIKGLSGK